MQNAQEFVPSFVPMNVDTATESNQALVKYNKSSLLASGAQTTPVSNTIDRTLITVGYYRSDGSLIFKQKMGTNGSMKYLSNYHDIHHFIISIPKEALPTSGLYLFSYSYLSDFAYSYSRIGIQAYKTTSNAASGSSQQVNIEPTHMSNAGEFSLSDPVLVDFRSMQAMNFICVPSENQQDIGGNFAVRFVVSDQQTTTSIGFQASQETNIADIAESSSQLVYSQNETNGLLQDIIQHISDQLAAMWDQIYNLMAVPWIQNDNQRTNNTISAIEENSENTQTTIEQQTQWHGNFIINGLKGLFIPSDDYFENVTSDLFDWFEEKFGFLGYTLTYFIRLLNGIMGASQNSVIHFPGIKVPNRATNEVYNILPEQDVDLGAQIGLITEGSFSLLEFMRTAGDIVLVLGFVVMLQNKLHEVETQ